MKRLIFSALAAAVMSLIGASAAQACPDWRYEGRRNLGTLSGSYLYTPRVWNVVAGGDQNLRNCSAPGVGWVVSDPDFQFNFHNDGGYRRLEFEVVGDCDTTLLVNDASGNWHFNDDGRGNLQPRLNVNAQSGTYDVWVGTYGQRNCNARIEIETWNNW